MTVGQVSKPAAGFQPAFGVLQRRLFAFIRVYLWP